jgi:hypothetical protein
MVCEIPSKLAKSGAIAEQDYAGNNRLREIINFGFSGVAPTIDRTGEIKRHAVTMHWTPISERSAFRPATHSHPIQRPDGNQFA